jgi:hypothetical protein
MIKKAFYFLLEKAKDFSYIGYRYRIFYFDKIKPIFFPKHSRIRKVIPRSWADITSLIVDVNFEFIKSFYEEEYKAGIVDWDYDKKHKDFAKWLESAYKYITVTRPRLEKELEEAYPSITKKFSDMFKEEVDKEGRKTYRLIDDGVPYKVKYKDVIRIEKNIEKKDTQLLTQLVEKRGYFWT